MQHSGQLRRINLRRLERQNQSTLRLVLHLLLLFVVSPVPWPRFALRSGTVLQFANSPTPQIASKCGAVSV